MTNSPRLDPRTAIVVFNYKPFGDYPDGDYCFGRVCYWCDPAGILPAVSDGELRSQYPRIGENLWNRLFREACQRDEEGPFPF
jgi:hypothetical protein